LAKFKGDGVVVPKSNAGAAPVKPKDAQKESLLCCPICMHRYDNLEKLPISLTCGHTLCKQCTVSMMTSRKVKCPFCS
jgi:hypothetical protein